MSTRRRIAVVTGSRAEYGHLRWLVRDLRDDPGIDVVVMAAAAHLSPSHGNTVAEIEADGVEVIRIQSLLAGDSPVAAAKSMALALMGFAEALEGWRPDVMVVLGDRFEMLAAAEASMLLRIPIAHLHGGEATEGAIDEACRHAITKMAHLHFVAAEPFARRVIQLGEDPARVFNVGAPGLDVLTRTTLLERVELEASLGVTLADPVLLVTHHPVTLAGGDPAAEVQALTAALDGVPGATVVVTGVNADPANAAIAATLRAWAAAHPHRVRLFDSLGSQRYHSLLRLCAAVVGNSSSGIIEAPAHHVPTVNIGERQRGRLRAASVIDCDATSASIAAAVARALSPEGQAAAKAAVPVYGIGDASRRIHQVLKSVPLDGILMKRFAGLSGADR
jgi:UDP-hydrolysing UDP-N-acetyl-D-glucosamine 2-epimerase